ncbi:hypothetical protein HPB50_004697 [Hyalomma asiaticum]|uniref:Uncharacterized protein n=1 Tax=Hyalomma asiaticum TaxID=266040 RepID=A0ACB7SV01_HYAAI|nr:hypothetical protein HPB50_004697 [Hyalomma asiaticum]
MKRTVDDEERPYIRVYLSLSTSRGARREERARLPRGGGHPQRLSPSNPGPSLVVPSRTEAAFPPRLLSTASFRREAETSAPGRLRSPATARALPRAPAAELESPVCASNRKGGRRHASSGTAPMECGDPANPSPLPRRRRQTRSVPQEEAKKSREARPALCPAAFQHFAHRNALGACAEGC